MGYIIQGDMTKSVFTAQYSRFMKALKRARMERGLTQGGAAKALNKPQSFVSKCESGERRVDVVELMEFSRLYGKPINYFLGGKGNEK